MIIISSEIPFKKDRPLPWTYGETNNQPSELQEAKNFSNSSSLFRSTHFSFQFILFLYILSLSLVIFISPTIPMDICLNILFQTIFMLIKVIKLYLFNLPLKHNIILPGLSKPVLWWGEQGRRCLLDALTYSWARGITNWIKVQSLYSARHGLVCLSVDWTIRWGNKRVKRVDWHWHIVIILSTGHKSFLWLKVFRNK